MANKPKYVSKIDAMRNKDRIVNLYEKKKEAKDKVSDAERQEFLQEMGAGNEEKINIYAQQLIQKTTAGIEAQMVATDFFDMGTIDVNNEPLIYTTDEKIDSKDAEVLEMTVHGRAPRKTMIQEGGIVRIKPYLVTSDEESMVKFSLRQGDISNAEKMEQRIEKGLSGKIDDDAWLVLENGLTTSLSSVEGIHIDSRVQQFPESIDVDMNAEGGITLEVLKRIAEHFDQLGISIENIYIPSNRRSDLWDWMSIPSGYSETDAVSANDVVPQDIHSQVIRTGTVNNLFGYPIDLIPLNTLNGDTSNGEVYIWVSTTADAGVFREIPEAGDVYTDEDAKRIYMQQSRAIAMFQTPAQKLNYMRVRIA